MFAWLLGFLLCTCLIISNESSVIGEDSDSVGSETSSTARSPILPEGYTAFPDVHAAYRVHAKNRSWNEARDQCIAEGAHLAITDSVEKVVHIKSLKTDEYAWVHVGIHQYNDTSEWLRVDNGLPPSFIPWIVDNPDGNGNCAGISLMGNGLVDYECVNTTAHYVCEIPLSDK